MTITDLANQAKVSEQQIKRRYKEIPGIEKDSEGNLAIPSGTRYPARRLPRIVTQEEKLYATLKAISEYCYIDEQMLRIPKESFDLIIGELLSQNWIRENGINNPHGANRYDATLQGSSIANKRRKKAIDDIAISIGSAAGAFVGNCINGVTG